MEGKNQDSSAIVTSNRNEKGELIINLNHDKLKHSGIIECAASKGDLTSYSFGLTSLYRRFKLIQRGWKDDMIDQINQTINGFKDQINQLTPKKKESEDKRVLFLGRIREIQLINADILSNPEKHKKGAETPNMLLVYIILPLLMLTTVFIILFYGSAVWSAFFEEFSKLKGLTVAVFNAEAFAEAFDRHWATGCLVTVIPFFVMLLGFLHAHYKNIKERATASLLILFGFIIDLALAINISIKIFKADMLMTGIDPVDPSFVQILQEPSFSLVILFGFGSYIIWGLGVGVVLIELGKKNIINNLLRRNNKEIDQQKEQKEEAEDEIIHFNASIQRCEISIHNEERKIDNLTDRLDISKFEEAGSIYSKGWVQQLKLFNFSDETLSELQQKYEAFIHNIGTPQNNED